MNDELTIKEPLEEPGFMEEHGYAAGPVPVSGMSSPEFFQREVTHIWKKLWLYIGKSNYLKEPGDYLVKDLEFANTSVIVIRGKDGKIRAFHNVCSHRCNKVMWDGTGNTRLLRCKFHGWVYGLDGKLEIVTDEHMFQDRDNKQLDKSRMGLTPIHCEEWEGFVFINLDEDEPLSLEEYLGDFYKGLHGYPFQEMTREYKWRIRINCNWKILRDAFIEVYHVTYLHKGTAAASFTNQDQPDVRGLSVKLTEYCGQYSMAANLKFQPPPNQALAFSLGGAAVQRVDSGRKTPASLNPTRALNWAGDLNMFFPSLGLPTFPGTYVLNYFLPVDATTSIYELHVCYDEPKNATERWTQEVSAALFHNGVLEDLKTLEHTQSVIEGGAKKEMYLQDNEILVRQNHELAQKLCGPYPT